MATAQINGLTTHYQRLPASGRTAGDRTAASDRADVPTVVCVHGLGYDSLASFFLTIASPLSQAGVDVVTYDLRGHGRSERPATGYSLDHFIDDLRAFVEYLAPSGPVHLVGNSFGGTIAYGFASRHPALVGSVVSIESEPPTAVWADKMGRTFRNVIEAMSDEGNLVWITDTFGAHYARLTRAAAQIINSTSIVDEVATGALLGEAELDALRCPVLSILGSEGFQSDDLLAVEALLPNCRTEIVVGQNHSVLVERHRLVRDLVLSWLVEQQAMAWARSDADVA